MKNFKFLLRITLVFVLTINLFTSCSVDSSLPEEKSLSDSMNNYIEAIENGNYQTGNRVNLSPQNAADMFDRSIALDEYVISEIFFEGEERANKYGIKYLENEEFIYFINVDREEYVIDLVDIANDEEIRFNNINENENYLRTNEFDFIEIANDYANQTEGKFWGWEQWNGPCDETTGQSVLMETYYVVGIGVKTRKVVGLDGGDVIEPCAGGALQD
tara:strand:+ start:1820 stop:2470 length:651 start_codon:yes stop_codon:yes gene_type:complete